MKLRAVDKPGQSGTQKSPRRRKKFFSEFFSFKSPAKVHEPDELPPGRCRSVGVVTSRVDAGLPTTYSVFASSSAYLGGKWSIYASLSRQLTVYMLVATGSVCWILLDAVAFIVEKLTKPLGVNYMGCIDVLEAAIESSVPEGSTTLQDLLWKKVSTGGEMEKGMRYRFGVGDRVMLRQTTENWQPGTVVLLEYREPHWLSSKTVPYQIRTDEGKLLYTPVDTDESVRPGNSVKAMSRKELEDFAAAAGHPVSGRPSKMRLCAVVHR
eukprot:gene21963-26455_t